MGHQAEVDGVQRSSRSLSRTQRRVARAVVAGLAAVALLAATPAPAPAKPKAGATTTTRPKRKTTAKQKATTTTTKRRTTTTAPRPKTTQPKATTTTTAKRPLVSTTTTASLAASTTTSSTRPTTVTSLPVTTAPPTTAPRRPPKPEIAATEARVYLTIAMADLLPGTPVSDDDVAAFRLVAQPDDNLRVAARKFLSERYAKLIELRESRRQVDCTLRLLDNLTKKHNGNPPSCDPAYKGPLPSA